MTHCWKGISWLPLMAAMVSGCASYPRATTPAVACPPPPASAMAAPCPDALAHAVAYAERIREAAPATLEAEYAAVAERHRRSPNPLTRLELAMLLASGRAPFRNDARARELLSHAANDPAAPAAELRPFAGLLLQALDERAALERAIDEERQQRQALQKKLDQLKTIEEEIDRRPPPPLVPKR